MIDTCDIAIAAFPLQVVEHHRARHDLPYRNRYDYDYTFRQTQIIPLVLQQWAEHGLDVSRGFVDRLWQNHADKRPGNADGEWHRAAKLTLDAFRATYDIAAIASLGNVQVYYSSRQDMAGRDLKIIGLGEPLWVQLRVLLHNDFLPTKELRRAARGEQSSSIVWTAHLDDLDTSRQPFVPTMYWYRRMVGEWQRQAFIKEIFG
jgi:hypothetical protein